MAIISELGFLVLMFMAGMEIDFASLRRAGMRALVTPALSVAGVFIAAIVASFFMGRMAKYGGLWPVWRPSTSSGAQSSARTSWTGIVQ